MATGMMLVGTAMPIFAATTVVHPGDMDGWAENESGGSTVEFVNGPETPPLGTGSAEFRVDATGATAAQLRNDTYDGLALADITELSYSTYVTNNNNEQAVYIILNVDTDGDGDSDDLLFFEPVYQDASFCSNDQGDVLVGEWQDWDARNGCWWSLSGNAGTPGTGVFTWEEILEVYPDATIAVSTNPTGAVRLVAGFGGPADWGNFIGNADAFSINEDTYDFELVEPLVINEPTSKDDCKNGGWMDMTDAEGNSFRNQGQCISYFNHHDGRGNDDVVHGSQQNNAARR